MRVLLDHCVDRRLAPLLPDHAVRTARQMRWDALKNGQSLSAAAPEFDALLTTDKNLRYQHDLEQLPIAVVEVHTLRNRLKDITPVLPGLLEAIALTANFLFVCIHADGTHETLVPRKVQHP